MYIIISLTPYIFSDVSPIPKQNYDVYCYYLSKAYTYSNWEIHDFIWNLCSGYILGISIGKVYTWYIPGTYHDFKIWVIQMNLNVNSWVECGRKLPNRLPNFSLISCLIDCLIAISVLFGSEMPSEIAHRPRRWERAFPMVAAIAALQITLSQIRQTIRQTIRRKLGSRLGVFV